MKSSFFVDVGCDDFRRAVRSSEKFEDKASEAAETDDENFVHNDQVADEDYVSDKISLEVSSIKLTTNDP